VKNFQNFIHWWYQQHGRHDLPWRKDFDPYKVLVSELMLQQTQVERVIPKFKAFIKQFPDVKTLAAAPLSQVLIAWQGLGYNRRAKYLHLTAKAVLEKGSQFPSSYDELLQLPGIGPYTASATMAFAYNQPITLIETNVRAVFLYHFFPGKRQVADSKLLPLIEKTLDKEQPRIWYSALMDYGATLKRLLPNPSRQSQHHTKQSKFEGSLRQTRGEILRVLSNHSILSQKQLFAKLQTKMDNHLPALEQLLNEELVFMDSGNLKLAN